MSEENWKDDITQTDKLNKSLLSSFLDRINSEPSSLHPNFELRQDTDGPEEDWPQEHCSPSMSLPDLTERLKINKSEQLVATKEKDLSVEKTKTPRKVIGIGGATCGGKTTLAKLIGKEYPDAEILLGDEYYYPFAEVMKRCPVDKEFNYPNCEVIESMDMDRLTRAVSEAAKTHRLVVVESLFITLHQPLMDLLTDIYFMTIDEETCGARRKLRTDYDPPPFALYFERFAWPAYVEHYKQAQELDNIQFLDSRIPVEVLFRRILRDLSVDRQEME